jgi:nicotinic acid mononucleotide adenylyltransferase
MASKVRKVCLFGTSANPPTGKGGHVGIVSSLSSLVADQGTSPRFDEVRVLPVYRHMFEEKRGNQVNFDDRIEMCRLAFGDIPNVVVSAQEREVFEVIASEKGVSTKEERLKLRVGTADLIEYLLKQNDQKGLNEEYTLALGSDTFMDLTTWKWRRSKDVIRLFEGRFIVLLRRTSNSKSQIECMTSETELVNKIKALGQELHNDPSAFINTMHVLDFSLGDISSSKVRSTSNKTFHSREMNSSVLEYMKEKELYTQSEEDNK